MYVSQIGNLAFKNSFIDFSSALLNVLLNKHVSSIDCIYTKFCQSKNKGVFRKEHSAEIALYETARKFLKEKSGNIKLPSMKLLKEKKEELLKQKKSAQEQYQYYRDYQKELNTVRSNINSILGKEYPHQKTHTKEQTLT